MDYNDTWEWLPTDLRTHLGDFENACKIAQKHEPESDDRLYWQHQLDTIEKIKEAIKEHHKQSWVQRREP